MTGNSAVVIRFATWMLALFVIFFLASSYKNAMGQQDEQPAAEANEPEDANEEATDESATSKSLGMLVVESGWFSWVFYVILFGFSIVAFMVALERAVNLTRPKIIPQEFCGALQELVNRTDSSAENFRSLSDSSSTSIARVLKAGVLRAGRPLPEVEKSMEDAVAREMADMRSRNRPLSVVGNIAPLVGLLGTVVGMIFAFSTASQVGLGRAEELAKGIYLALLTTAGGLSIAIPAMLASAFFSARVERFMREIDEALLETMPCFARMENHIISTRISEPAPVSEPAQDAEVVEAR